MGEPGAGYGSGNRFDFWIPVHDRASATYAVRMSGLPVFLIGLSLALSGLVLLVDPVSPMTLGWILAALSVPLIVLGLMLRGGRASLAPVACALFLGAAAIEVWIAPSWGLVVRGLIALVALSGLRGWWWLRQHPE